MERGNKNKLVPGTREGADRARELRPGQDALRRQLSQVEELMLRAVGDRKILDAVARPVEAGGLGVSRTRARKLMALVRERWTREDDGLRAVRKSEQRRRIQGHLAKAMGGRQADGTIVPTNHQAVARYESLLADIDGTREPISVDVNVKYTETIVRVLMLMTPEQVQGRLEVARERERRARAFLEEHPEEAPRPELNGTGKH